MSKRQVPHHSDDDDSQHSSPRPPPGARPTEPPPQQPAVNVGMAYFRPDGRKIQSFSKPLKFPPLTTKKAKAAFRKRGYCNPIQERELRIFRRQAAIERRLDEQEAREERLKREKEKREAREREDTARRIAAGLPAKEPGKVQEGQKRLSEFFRPRETRIIATDGINGEAGDEAPHDVDEADIDEEELMYDEFDDAELIASILTAEESDDERDAPAGGYPLPTPSARSNAGGIIQQEENLTGTQYRIIHPSDRKLTAHPRSPPFSPTRRVRPHGTSLLDHRASPESSSNTIRSSATLLGDGMEDAEDVVAGHEQTLGQVDQQTIEASQDSVSCIQSRVSKFEQETTSTNRIAADDLEGFFASNTQIERELASQTSPGKLFPRGTTNPDPPNARARSEPLSEISIDELEDAFVSSTQLERELAEEDGRNSSPSVGARNEHSVPRARSSEGASSKVSPEPADDEEISEFIVSNTQLEREMTEEAASPETPDTASMMGQHVPASFSPIDLEDAFVSDSQLQRELNEPSTK